MTNYTFKAAFIANFKAIKIMFVNYPMSFISYGVGAVYNNLVPYIYLYLISMLINELSLKTLNEIWKDVAIILFFSFVSRMVSFILIHWENYSNSIFGIDKEKILINKLLELDFKDIDSTHTFDLLSQIHMGENFAGYGMGKSVDIYKKFLSTITKISGAIVLCWSLFSVKITEGRFVFLNSPLFIVGIVISMVLVAILSPVVSNKAKSYWASIAGKANLANRLYSFYGYLAYDHNRALDIRMYRQNELCEKGYHNFNSFRPGGEIANCAKGYMGVMLSLSVALSYILTWIIYVFVCLKAWAGAFGLGSITQYIGALTSMSGGISDLFSLYGDMQTNTPFLNTVFEFLDINIKNEARQEVAKEDFDWPKIEFKNVYFKYPNSPNWILEDISCVIEKGKNIAIVGENGSGKTTFIKLLCKLYMPDKGEILLNGVNIEEYDFYSYISIISAIFQDFNLVSQTIKDNIAATNIVDLERAWMSTKKAGIENYINQLPQKMDTFLYKDYSEEGINLSGGEEQKIAISRAFYKKSGYLVLDEPTASLDPVSESDIYAKLNEMSKLKSMIFVSHRLSSCVFCDEILVFDNGRIIQSDRHDILVKVEGKYKELWQAQAQYYK